MCGICGIINFNKKPTDELNLRKMMSSMKHRGPDDEGVFLHEQVGFGFVRLSIIDLTSAGHQPMISEDGRYILVFNGEIYNYLEIREELISRGCSFVTQTDSEVLLKAYIVWGSRCLKRLNGMWAFAIYDRQKNIILAARDRYGVKPFYFFKDSTQLIFASEIPPILKVLKEKPKPNNQAIYDFLIFNRTDQTEETFFLNINRLQHGHLLQIDLNTTDYSKLIVDKKWYDLYCSIKRPFNTPEEFREEVKTSIKLRLRSDVPVGVCLSGGLDSSSIVSILLKDFDKKDLNTFSAIYKKGQIGDESSYINLYKHQLENMFFIKPDASSFRKDIENFIRVHAEPIPDTSPYAQYKVMEIAKGKVIVTLDGQGADELLGGYHYFFGLYFKELLSGLKFQKLFHEIKLYFKKHHSIFAFKTFLYFVLPARIRTLFLIQTRGYINRDFVRKHKNNNQISDTIYASRSLHEALLDHFEYKLEHLLKWEDRNSMCFSIEARVPFLDHRLVEQTLSINTEKLINNGSTKTILRDAMVGTLPEEIRLRQDKIGFATPEDEWFRSSEFRKFIPDLLNSESFKSRGYVDYKKCLNKYQKHLKNKGNYSREIWKWINLELWFREFID